MTKKILILPGDGIGPEIVGEAVKVLADEKLVQNSAKLGPWFMKELGKIKSKHIKKVRGKGLWVGLVLDVPARPYCEALMAEGMLCKETHDNIIRFAPPLVIKKAEVDWALEQINAVMTT